MKFKRVQFVLSFVVYGYLDLVTSLPCSRLNDSSDYTAIENALLTNRNMNELEKAFFPTNQHSSMVVKAFFPTNQHSSMVVNVNYHFYKANTKANSDDDITPESCLPVNTKTELFCLQFRWLASPINLVTRRELLERLALMAYRGNVESVNLKLEASCTMGGKPSTQTTNVKMEIKQS
jgi:hypothetical protein